jgi:PAS domain S-box-containing protein
VAAAMPKILTVDDDLRIRQCIAQWLEGEGYEVIEAENGMVGLEKLRAERPDVVLLDMSMPVLDGLGFLERLPEVDSSPPPVLVFSGKSDLADVVESFKLGALDFIPKPIENFDILEHAIQNALERNALARKAALAERRYFNLVQNLPLVIYVLRRDFRLEFINKFCFDVLGFSRVEVFDDPDWLVSRIYPEDREAIRQILLNTFESQDETFTEECRFIHKDGHTVHCILTSMPSSLNPPGEPAAFIEGILMDITDRVELEKFVVQEEKLKTLGAMSAEVAHEIRNPLFSIAGFAKRLHDKAPEFKETGIILAEAGRLEVILNRISDYLHPVEMRPRPCSLNEIAASALKLLLAETAANGEAPVTEFAPGLPTVTEDPDLLSQAVINLAGHALRRAENPGRITLRTNFDGRLVHLEVRFAPRTPTRKPELLFLPFDDGEENQGLPFAYRIIKNMGGALTYEQERSDAVFTISLPRNVPA